MATKTKAATRAVKKGVRKAGAKVKPVLKKAVAKAKRRAKPAAKKVSAKAGPAKAKGKGLMAIIKQRVRAEIKTVGELVKKLTPKIKNRVAVAPIYPPWP